MKGYLFSDSKRRQYFLLMGDFSVLTASIIITYSLRLYLVYDSINIDMFISKLTPWVFLVILTHIFFLYLFDQYNLNRLINLNRSIINIVFSIWLSGLMISACLFFVPRYVLGRQVILLHLLVLTIFILCWRSLAYWMIIKRARKKKMAIVANRHIVSVFMEELKKIKNNPFTVSHVCLSEPRNLKACILSEALPTCSRLDDLLKKQNFDILVSDFTNEIFSNEEVQHLLQLKYKGKGVFDLPTLYKNLTGRVPLKLVNGHWLLNRYGLQGEISKPYIRLKRLLDIFLSSFLLLFLSPVFLLLAGVIKVEGKGDILYRQERLGLGRQPFVCYKFRTMIENAEQQSGPVWSTENDRRVTPLGNLLRKLRLDELPQLYNILKGEMSFVGPRPIREYFAIKMAEKVPFYWLRYDVKPGVTGWAQVNGIYAVPDGLDAFEYELFYIENMSIFLDILTLVKTFQTVFLGKGK